MQDVAEVAPDGGGFGGEGDLFEGGEMGERERFEADVGAFEDGGHRGALREIYAVHAELEESFGDVVVVVAEDFAFVDEVAGDGFDAEGADAVEVGFDGLLALAGVLCEQRG